MTDAVVDIHEVSMSPLQRMRHSAAHVLAEAVVDLFPGAKLGIGPPIENGFYYDFDLPRPLTPDDLARIEGRMAESIAADYAFQRQPVTLEEARRIFADQPYKLELIDRFADGELSIYRHGEFVDLCRGPHVERTGQLGPFKLTSVAGAYWQGDSSRPQLQRVYGTMWPTQDELESYLFRLEEARRRDHRVLGRDLDLFHISDTVGPGLVLWHPKGSVVRQVIEDFWREIHAERGYEMVFSPHIGKAGLWRTSGHLDFFAENMYAPMDIEGQEYFIKPMNCPFHIEIFGSRTRSYRDLPLRWGELGTVYRYEVSGALHGLLRVRGFTQDDAHIFCRPDQIEDEILAALRFARDLLAAFGFTDFHAYLSTRPPHKAVGSPEQWERAEAALRLALQTTETPFDVDEGGGAFYGPKIDLKIRDVLQREWQCSTIQFDFNLPERFGISYVGEDNEHHQPYMVHRALFGSVERFFAVLVEHYAGAFPPWLAPVQVVVLPIADRHAEYAQTVADEMARAGFRVEMDARQERLQARIRDAQLAKVPYILVTGDREAASGTAAVRLRTGVDLGSRPVDEVIAAIGKDVQARVSQPGEGV